MFGKDYILKVILQDYWKKLYKDINKNAIKDPKKQIPKILRRNSLM